MKTRVIIAVCLCLLSGLGCIGSIKTPKSRRQVMRQAEMNERAAAEREDAAVPVNADDDGPLQHLNVKGTILHADEVWSRFRDRLVEQRGLLNPRAFDAYVQRESVALINDKLGEALLYHDAVLRMPKGVDARLGDIVDDQIRKLVTTEYGGVQRRYERALAEQGRTLEEEREARLRQLTITAYLDQEFRTQIDEPTRAELMAVYQERKEEWRRPPKRKMSLIDLRILEFLPEDVREPTRDEFEAAKSEARSEAERLVEQARLGTPFAELAERHSHGLHAEEGGSWGWVTRGMVRDRFVPAVDELYRLEEGAVGGPVETPDGFFVVRCDKIDPGYDPDFESIQPRLKTTYQQEQYTRLVTEHIAELRETSGISVRMLERFHMAVVNDAKSYDPEMGPS